MIVGIGTDIVSVARMADLHIRHGARALDKLLAAAERDECAAAPDAARFLAKRFAAKEALGKALGTGLRAPAVMPAIAIVHDALGRPAFAFDEALAARMAGLTAHLSISDEREYAVAFVVLDKT